jgi:hypothetical protein
LRLLRLELEPRPSGKPDLGEDINRNRQIRDGMRGIYLLLIGLQKRGEGAAESLAEKGNPALSPASHIAGPPSCQTDATYQHCLLSEKVSKKRGKARNDEQ